MRRKTVRQYDNELPLRLGLLDQIPLRPEQGKRIAVFLVGGYVHQIVLFLRPPVEVDEHIRLDRRLIMRRTMLDNRMFNAGTAQHLMKNDAGLHR